MRNVFIGCLLPGALLLAGCDDQNRSGAGARDSQHGTKVVQPSRATSDSRLGAVTLIPAPAAPGARYPRLAGGEDGTPIVMSWLEPAHAHGFSLRHARWHGSDWGSVGTVASGEDWFINWADFPSVAPVTRSLWTAHWLQRRSGNVYAYDVRLRTSADGGATWSRPVSPHDDDTPTEHGFVSIVGGGSQPYVAWLDGRNTVSAGQGHAEHDDAGGAMTLRAAALGADGNVSSGNEIDGRVCDCCQTDAVRAGSAVLVVYRDRSENETRDISIVRLQDGKWSAPLPVHDDGWRIDGCPVNGPAIDASGSRVAVAWFTAPDQPRVRLAFSDDTGRSFAAPVEVASGKVVGRVGVALLDDHRAVVSWLEEVAGGAEVRARIFTAQGAAGPARTIARSAVGRASGFPQMIFDGRQLLFAWTQTGDPTRIQTAVVTLQ